jgi:hypothetical protein
MANQATILVSTLFAAAGHHGLNNNALVSSEESYLAYDIYLLCKYSDENATT